MLSDKINDSTITLELDNLQYTIHLSDMDRAHKAIKSASSSFTGAIEVRGIMSHIELAEMAYTMRFARELGPFPVWEGSFQRSMLPPSPIPL